MKIPLETFELHYSDNSLVKGEKLFDDEKVEGISKVDKNLWIATIQDKGSLEVEVILSPKFLKKATCECEYFKHHKECEHLVATLFWLRKHKEKKSKATKKTTRKPSYNTISIPVILNEMNRNELQDYVRAIARRDKNIANDIKLKYAYKVDHIKAKDKYRDILNAIFRPYIVKNKISITQTRNLFKLVVDLLDQATDFAALKQYDESIHAGLAAYQKINYLYGKMQIEHKNKYKDSMIEAHRKMEYILGQDLAPKLKRIGVSHIEDLALSNYYHWVDIKHNFIHYLWENHWDSKQQDNVISNVLPALKGKLYDHQLVLYDALGFMLSLKKDGLIEDQKVSLATMEVPHFRDICKELYQHSAALVDQLCLYALDLARNFALRKFAFGILSADELNTPSILDYAESLHELLVYTGDVQVAKWLVKNDPSIPRQLEFIVDRMYKHLAQDKANRLILEIYSEMKLYDKMIDILSNHLKVNYFDLFAHNLWLESPQDFQRVCVESMKRYLQNHIGQIALQKATSLMSFLETIHAYEVVSALRAMIKEEFSHRKILSNTING